MTALATLGLFYVVFAVGLFTAALLILATFGAVVTWKLLLRGAETTERELKDGRSIREVILGIDQIGRVK